MGAATEPESIHPRALFGIEAGMRPAGKNGPGKDHGRTPRRSVHRQPRAQEELSIDTEAARVAALKSEMGSSSWRVQGVRSDTPRPGDRRENTPVTGGNGDGRAGDERMYARSWKRYGGLRATVPRGRRESDNCRRRANRTRHATGKSINWRRTDRCASDDHLGVHRGRNTGSARTYGCSRRFIRQGTPLPR
jgi:hypothetical protein